MAQIDAIYPLARVGYAHRHIKRSAYIGNTVPSCAMHDQAVRGADKSGK